MLTADAKNEIDTLIKERKGEFFTINALEKLAVNNCHIIDILNYLNQLKKRGIISEHPEKKGTYFC